MATSSQVPQQQQSLRVLTWTSPKKSPGLASTALIFILCLKVLSANANFKDTVSTAGQSVPNEAYQSPASNLDNFLNGFFPENKNGKINS